MGSAVRALEELMSTPAVLKPVLPIYPIRGWRVKIKIVQDSAQGLAAISLLPL
jgi:hypothetical protein